MYDLPVGPVPDAGTPPRPVARDPRPVTQATGHEQVAKNFESVLLTRLFEQVQESIGTWDLEEDGTSQQVQGLFWFYLAQDVADKGGFGLWKEIDAHLRQMDNAPQFSREF